MAGVTFDLAAFDTIVEWMRDRGVRSVTLPNGVSVEVFDRAVVAAESDAETPPVEKTERPCNCPHADHEHSDDGMCLMGCDPVVCATKPKE